MADENPVVIALTDQERYLLRRGLAEWGGPARPSQEILAAMGSESLDDLLHQHRRLQDALENDQPLTWRDRGRVLLATEIAFASDVIGSGLDWSSTTGLSDEESIRLLRAVQRKVLNG